MITVLFHVTVKSGKDRSFRELVERLTVTTREEDEGCLTYIWHQRQDDPREYTLYEQWRDQEALDAHIRHLQVLYGPPRPGTVLPARILDQCENTRGIPYDVVA